MTHKLSLLTPRGDSISVTISGEGIPLMLLHGFPLDHRMWEQQIAYFRHSMKVIAIDFRGFGDSSLGDVEYDLSDLADDVEFVRQHLTDNEPMFLCGLSMGGYVAFDYWARHSAHLKGLIFANTKPQADSPAAREGRLQMAKLALESGTRTAVEGMRSKLLGHVTGQNNPTEKSRNLVNQLDTMMHSASPQAIAFAQRAMAKREDFVEHLAKMRVPSLVLTGSDDVLAPPEDTRQWACKIPQGKFQVLEGSGHLSPMEVSQQFDTAVESFIQTLL
jgi:pimeloyl-ACP methyl ester carboxylesterase